MSKKIYQCSKCKQATTFHKIGYPCAYCGNTEMVEYQPLIKEPSNEVELNRKEIMIAFKRLVDVENRIETIENKLRG